MSRFTPLACLLVGPFACADNGRSSETDAVLYSRLFDGSVLAAAAHGTDVLSPAPLDQWIGQEDGVATAKLLASIAPSGAAPGSVEASPSRQNPDYYYNWIRDAGITMSAVDTLYEQASTPQDQQKYLTMLQNYADFSLQNQQTQTLTGLGEPKFNMDGTAYNDPWGRPQDDGPALRAIALTEFAQDLLAQGKQDYVRQTLYDGQLPTHSVIKADLEYVAHHWQEPCFDLWEEVKGHHFYTGMVQRKALINGAKLARALNDAGAATFYEQQASAIAGALLQHWDASKGVIVPTLGQTDGIAYKGSGLDTSVILGVIQGNTGDGFFAPTDDRVLATASKLEDAFNSLYPINQKPNGPGEAIGRYPEDRYDGTTTTGSGNPWILTTLGMGQFYYQAAETYEKTGSIKLTPLNRKFFEHRGMKKSHAAVTISSADPRFSATIADLRQTGDSFLSAVRRYANPDGSMSEQINRSTGMMTSAGDLTWNYAAFLDASWARAQLAGSSPQ